MGSEKILTRHPGWRVRAHQLWGSIRRRVQPKSTPVSIYRRITGFVAAIVLISMLLGSLPAGYALWQTFDQQIRLRVENASLATQALYTAERDAWLKGISLITRRPALCDLITGGDARQLDAYLEILRRDMPAQTLVILSEGKPPLFSGATSLPEIQDLLQSRSLPFADFAAFGDPPVLSILAASQMENTQHCPAVVVAVQVLDSDFMRSLSSSTGLQQSLLVGGHRSATSLPGAPDWSLPWLAAQPDSSTRAACCTIVRSQHEHYYISFTPLLDRQGRLVATSEIALPTNTIRRQMQVILGLYAGSVLLIALGSAFAAASLTRRIIQPMRDLSDAAERIGRGDLDSPLPVQSGWLELDQLAARLDDSRQQLRSRYELSQREKRHFAVLLNAVPAGIVTLNEERLVTWLNPEAEQLLGYSLPSALRRSYHEIFHPAPGAEPTLSDLLDHHEDTTIPRRLKFLDPEGRPMTLAITAAWMEDDQSSISRREWVLVMRQVTEDEAAEQLRTKYLATLAHEFRTPLSSILASTELLVEDLSEMDPAEAASLANAARLSTLHLLALVNNILESAAIEAGAFQLRCRPVIFQGVLQQAVQILAPLLQRRDQQLRIDAPSEPIALWADPDRINQVFVNLIGNASRFGPRGSAVIVTIHIKGNELLACILDSGPGFASGRLSYLFNRLFVSNPPPGFTQGIGLGLPIVKTIIEAHDGQVGAENRPEGGARVWFSLPLPEQLTPEIAQPLQEGLP